MTRGANRWWQAPVATGVTALFLAVMLVVAGMFVAAMGSGAAAQDQISSHRPESNRPESKQFSSHRPEPNRPESTQPGSGQPESNEFSSLADSLFVLGESYEAGEWVRQSDQLAYMWYLLAATAGHAPAEPARHRMATRLSPAEIAAARALARQCHASDYWRCGETSAAEDLATATASTTASTTASSGTVSASAVQ